MPVSDNVVTVVTPSDELGDEELEMWPGGTQTRATAQSAQDLCTYDGFEDPRLVAAGRRQIKVLVEGLAVDLPGDSAVDD